MSSSSAIKFSLKVMTNKHKTKVLFAEANTDFINVLSTLPLGKLAASPAPAIGSITTLYKGLFDLNIAHFSAPGAKKMLLDPQSSFRPECRDMPNQYFLCPDLECERYAYSNISMYSDTAACDCGRWLSREMRIGESVDDDGGDFVINPLLFIITDDLRAAPVVTGIIQTLADLGITDTEGAEMKSLSFGMDQKSEMEKPQQVISLHHIAKEDAAESRKMVLKVCLQKSTNKFLFAEATDEFLDFISSFLTIPLGGVRLLLGGKTGLKCVDNLFDSILDGIDDDKCSTIQDTKNRLMNPRLPHGYISKNQFLPLSEEAPPKLYYQQGKWIEKRLRYEYSFHGREGSLVSSFKSCKDLFIKKEMVCFVSDDLTISPSLVTSIMILNDLGIPLSDVEETELQIGLEEALGILKASLTSKTALTDGLIKLMPIKRQP